MKRSEKAKELFLQGYNCSQAVLGAFCDVMQLDFESAMRLASSFGGGIARMREVCGACSAMFMVAGAVRGNSSPDVKAKSEHYAFVQSMASAFIESNGSIICRELLALRAKASSSVDNGNTPQANDRTCEYYRTRPCLGVVEDAVNITCRMLDIDENYGECAKI